MLGGEDSVESSIVMDRGSLICLGIDVLGGGWVMGMFMGVLTSLIWFDQFINEVNGWGR